MQLIIVETSRLTWWHDKVRGNKPKFLLFADQFVFLLISGKKEKELQNRDKKTIWINFLEQERNVWSYAERDLEVIFDHWSYWAFQPAIPFLLGGDKPLCSALLPAACSQLPCSAFTLLEGTEDKWGAHAENLSVLAELLNLFRDGWLLLQPHNALGGAGVELDWTSHLLSLFLVPT